MVALLMIGLQVAGPPAPVTPIRVPTLNPCPVASDTDDIVVCARPNEADRLRPLPEKYVRRDGPPKAEVRVFGDAKLAVEAEQGADAQGGPINRAMVRLKIPF